MPIRLDILELEKIKNNGKIDRTFDWFRKEQNMQPSYYLLKLRANSLTSPKNWEVGLKGRMTPASSIPLQSKDTALFQRDLNLMFYVLVGNLRRKTLPCSKGI